MSRIAGILPDEARFDELRQAEEPLSAFASGLGGGMDALNQLTTGVSGPDQVPGTGKALAAGTQIDRVELLNEGFANFLDTDPKAKASKIFKEPAAASHAEAASSLPDESRAGQALSSASDFIRKAEVALATEAPDFGKLTDPGDGSPVGEEKVGTFKASFGGEIEPESEAVATPIGVKDDGTEVFGGKNFVLERPEDDEPGTLTVREGLTEEETDQVAEDSNELILTLEAADQGLELDEEGYTVVFQEFEKSIFDMIVSTYVEDQMQQIEQDDLVTAEVVRRERGLKDI